MKIVIIGGSGLIGSKLAVLLRDAGHQVLAASPRSGVDATTGRGLAEAFAGAQVVVDVANSPSFEDRAALEFFESAGRHIGQAEIAAGVRHHVALSVVGAQRMADSGYMRAKVAQERLIRASGVPFTIVHATQFLEFVDGIAQAATSGQEARLSTAFIQAIASDDVAAAMARHALGAPLDGSVEIAGPQRMRLCALVQRYLAARHDGRRVVEDVRAPYFGVVLDEDTLLPGPGAWLGATTFDQWMARQ